MLANYQLAVNIVIQNDENDSLAGNRANEQITAQKSIPLGKYLLENGKNHPSTRLETTTAEYVNETQLQNNQTTKGTKQDAYSSKNEGNPK